MTIILQLMLLYKILMKDLKNIKRTVLRYQHYCQRIVGCFGQKMKTVRRKALKSLKKCLKSMNHH